MGKVVKHRTQETHMAEEQPVILKFPVQEGDELADILVVLHHMAERATSPVVRACLEEAAEDIAHLTASGDGRQEEDAQPAAG
jgi:hypothetical protein